jgi:phage N-6-adenine-methyltransferase
MAFENIGHNETAVRLGLLAEDARKALARVESGESTAIDGWLAYGAALNEGRALFPVGDNARFSEWLANGNLPFEVEGHDRAAAMWASANRDQFEEARAAGNARTVRGIYAKWKEIDDRRKAEAEAEAERIRAQAAKEEAQRRAAAEAEARREAEEAAEEAERFAAEQRAEVEAEAKEAAEAEAWEAEKKAKAADKKATAKAKTDSDGNYRTNNTGENEWYTPAEFVAMARRVMGGIDLDPASCAEANKTVNASVFFTERDNGLDQHWEGKVWLNPPYSRDLMPAFCEKLASHVDAGDVTDAVLVSHNNTDTGWFHRLSDSCAAACFPSKRIRFYRGEDVAAPVNGQVFFYFGKNVEAFREEFGRIGWVVVPA